MRGFTVLRITFNVALMCILVFVCTLFSCNRFESPNVDVQFVTSRVGWIIGPRGKRGDSNESGKLNY